MLRRRGDAGPELLVFRHPRAGVQLVKGGRWHPVFVRALHHIRGALVAGD